MAKPRALYFSMLNYDDAHLARVRRELELIERSTPDHATDQDLADIELLFAPLGYYFDASWMNRAPKLRVIASNTTGIPHIDDEEARRRGIHIASMAGEREFLSTITPTAELTLGLMIAITRNLAPASTFVERGQWGRWGWAGPRMLSRMSLGVIGLGRLGVLVAGYAKAIGMRVGYYDPHVDSDTAVRYHDPTELVGASDIVSLHATVTPSSRKIINRDLLATFRPQSFLVNTARGELVDEDALIDALDRNHLAGAALDVVDGEFEPGFEHRAASHPLIKYAAAHPKLLITPHIGGSTRDAWQLTQGFAIDRALAALARPREAQSS